MRLPVPAKRRVPTRLGECGRPRVQPVLRPLRYLLAYGSTNKYRPVTNCNASGITAKRPTEAVYFFCAMAMMFTITATVKATDSHRWICRTHLFQFNGASSEDESFCDSRILCRLGQLVGRFNTELFRVLRVQPLPTFELHDLGASDAADGTSAKKVIQNIEGNVPARGAPRDEAAIDVAPQRQARATAKRFEFPTVIAVFKHLGSVSSRHSSFDRRGRSHPGQFHRSNRTQVRVGHKGRPLAQMRRVGERLPDFFRRVAQFSDENERPLIFVVLYPILSYLRPVGRTRCVLLAIGHLLLLASVWI